jgi:hypothetical protein
MRRKRQAALRAGSWGSADGAALIRPTPMRRFFLYPWFRQAIFNS